MVFMDNFHFHFRGQEIDLRGVFLSSAIAVSVVLVFYYKLNSRRRSLENDRRLPPGPRPWPIIGSLGWVGRGRIAHQNFAKLAKEYGPIVYLRLGSVPTVVVSSPKMAEVILKTKDHIFASRPEFDQVGYNKYTVGSAHYGPYWRYARQVLTVGMLTDKRIQQFQSLRKKLATLTLHSILEECKMRKVVSLHIHFGQLTKKNTTQMMINESFFGPNSTASNMIKAPEYQESILDLGRLMGVFNYGDYVPPLKNFDLQGYRKEMQKVRGTNDIFFGKIIDEHRQILSSKSSEELTKRDGMDLIDLLLTRAGEDDGKQLTEDQIRGFLMGVVVAGAATSMNAMEWAMTELLKHPAALKRVQEELDTVVGSNRLVQETDIPNLKYLRAVVKETFRLHPVLPLLIPHWTLESCEVAGYHIPANCQVFVNTWAMGRDPDTWERPLEFDPERFLKNNIEYLGLDFRFLPFGSGRRSCPGRNVGLLIVEYTLAVLLHACNWQLPPGVGPEDVDLGEEEGLNCPKIIPLEATASPRLPVHIIYPE